MKARPKATCWPSVHRFISDSVLAVASKRLSGLKARERNATPKFPVWTEGHQPTRPLAAVERPAAADREKRLLQSLDRLVARKIVRSVAQQRNTFHGQEKAALGISEEA